jgi:hypothetical protein
VIRTELTTSRAPGKTSCGYGRASCSFLLNFESTTVLGLGIILGGMEWKAYLIIATRARVVATEVPTRVRFRGSSRGSRERSISMMR